MTSPKMDARTLIVEGDDGDFLRELIGSAAQRLMELEVETVAGASYGERSAERQTRRNGYRDRQWKTPAELRGQHAAQALAHEPLAMAACKVQSVVQFPCSSTGRSATL